MLEPRRPVTQGGNRCLARKVIVNPKRCDRWLSSGVGPYGGGPGGGLEAGPADDCLGTASIFNRPLAVKKFPVPPFSKPRGIQGYFYKIGWPCLACLASSHNPVAEGPS